MINNLSSVFLNRQYMISKDFEIYYYKDRNLRNVEPHSHDYYEFYFFLEGEVTMFYSDSSRRMKNGDMVIIPPGMQHHVQIHDPAVPYRRVVFWITKSFLSKLSVHSEEFLFLTGKADGSGFAWHFNEVTFNTVQRKIFHVIEEIFSDRFGRRMAVALGINDLLLFLNRTVYESLHPERYGKSEKNLDRNLIRYIEEHINEDLRLDTLSELFFVSKYHISHLFKDKMGISLHQYILKKRLSMSKDALINGRKPSEVFREYGFSDYSVFYRAFVKEFGLSPQNLIRHRRPVGSRWSVKALMV